MRRVERIKRATKGPRGPVGKLYRALAASVRLKLLTLVLSPLLLGVPLLLFIVWVWGTQGYNQLLVNKVSSDLVTAHQYFDRMQNSVRSGVEGFAASSRLAHSLADSRNPEMEMLLHTAAQELGLDYLLLLDSRGHVLVGGTGLEGTDRSQLEVVQEAVRGRSLHGLEIFSPQQLEQVNPQLRQRARQELLPTPHAAPIPGPKAEERGLMIHIAVPISQQDGPSVGILEGGVLLNGNQDIVDRINTIVYQDASLPQGSQGTATLFLEDIRIATNVRLFEGSRALGTRVSQAVRKKVLEQGELWLGSAFVVNDTYVSGYEPLLNLAGERIGMLYVGFLESPLQNTLHQALAGLFLLFLLVSGLGTLMALRGAQNIFRPLERMKRVMTRIEAGEEGARMGATTRQDELGHLSRAFDHLLDSLAARRTEIQLAADELDRKVAERTAALEGANMTLRQAQQQLVMNEKLTAIGELTAGVAHEINNPITVIQGNLDLLVDILADQAEPVHAEIDIIHAQTERIRVIVTKLLQFARPGDFAGYAEAIDVNDVVADCLVLTRHNLNRADVKIKTQLDASTRVEISRGELQQVLINLIMNAMQAMPDGGTLYVSSEDTLLQTEGGESPGVTIKVRDTGHGIAPGDMDRIFDPFYTTKKQEGTGLGLSISYAIIQRYGGRITVDSTPGEHTTFTLCLHQQARFSDQSNAPVFAARFLQQRT